MSTLLLNGLSLAMLLSAVFVITASSPVTSVLYLIATFVCGGCYLIQMGLGFVGLSYLIVYIGAVAILFLFVVMLMNVQYQELLTVGAEYSQSVPLGFVMALVFLLELYSIGLSLITMVADAPTSLFNSLNQLVLGVHSGHAGPSLHEAYTSLDYDSVVANSSQVELLGYGLYTYGTMWLLLTSLLLLLAMMGPIVLCMRRS